MLGSLTAIVFAGMLNYVGKRYPHLTGEGRLQPGEHDDMDPSSEEITRPHGRDATSRAAGITAITLYLLGIAVPAACSACRRRWRCCSSRCW